MDTIICVRCGEKTLRTGKNQKYCRACARIVDLEQKRLAGKHRRRMFKKPVVMTNSGKVLCQWKPDTRGIGECPRRNECAYGAEEGEDIRFGACRYSEITGHCKIVVIDRKRTVEPTKNCRFFKPKEEAEDATRE